ncbi:hypothetical protein KR215_002354 [Drosophila sulfurigaster]|nr:hypothetical protein KR215_002354 [Drosophila sulfurigaster]
MRKNVISRKETKDQRNSPMWYTAAAEYSRKKRLADRLAACKQEVAAFEKRIRSYSQEMEMYPISRSPPRARSISPSNQFRGCVVPTPRFDGGTTRSRPRCRSKTPTTGLRNVATATARPLDRFVSSTSRSLSPPRRGQRKSYPSGHGLASTSTIKRNNPKEPFTSRASSSASESDDDNENQPQVIDVTSKASQRATNIAQLIMVKPSRKSIMSVKKAISMQKLRMTSGSVPNRLSKASKKTIASVSVEQPDESDVSEKAPVEAEQQESIQETVLETEAEPEPKPKVTSARQSEANSERQSKVDSRGPDVQYYSTSERELDSVVDGQQEEVPDIEIFHCYPNECQGGTGGPSSIICGECNGNGTSNLINQARGNVLRSCSVTEEHFIRL